MFYFLAISEWGHLDATSSFTLCLVGWILGGVENIGRKMGRKMVFPLFGNGRKTGGVENPGEKFLSRAHKFFPPKSRGKQGEKTTSVQFYRNTLFWNQEKKKNRERERWS